VLQLAHERLQLRLLLVGAAEDEAGAQRDGLDLLQAAGSSWASASATPRLPPRVLARPRKAWPK